MEILNLDESTLIVVLAVVGALLLGLFGIIYAVVSARKDPSKSRVQDLTHTSDWMVDHSDSSDFGDDGDSDDD